MQAAALAAAEHGYDNREYYVDDGENYFNDEYGDSDYYGDGGYVGAEGMHPSLSRGDHKTPAVVCCFVKCISILCG